MRSEVIDFLAEEYEHAVEEFHDDMGLVEDIGLDSLSFLELFDELKMNHQLQVDVRDVGRYAMEHPVQTLGEFLEQIYLFVEGRIDLTTPSATDGPLEG